MFVPFRWFSSIALLVFFTFSIQWLFSIVSRVLDMIEKQEKTIARKWHENHRNT